jgi:PilZ domain
MSGEKRGSVRRDARYSVWIAYGEDRTLVPCTLLDVSQSGARLMLPGNEDVPDNFVLLLSEHGRARPQCRVAWRHKDKVGVEFAVFGM